MEMSWEWDDGGVKSSYSSTICMREDWCVCAGALCACVNRDETKLASHTRRYHPWQNKPGLLYQKASSSLVLFSRLFDHPLQLDFDLQIAFWRSLSCARYWCIYFMFLFIMCPKQHSLHEVLSPFLIFLFLHNWKKTKMSPMPVICQNQTEKIINIFISKAH